jgi:hypothetical protein
MNIWLILLLLTSAGGVYLLLGPLDPYRRRNKR